LDTSEHGSFKVCIKATSLGKIEAIKEIILEVCGGEKISIIPSENPLVKSGPHSL
jgi:hypothetical protein